MEIHFALNTGPGSRFIEGLAHVVVDVTPRIGEGERTSQPAWMAIQGLSEGFADGLRVSRFLVG